MKADLKCETTDLLQSMQKGSVAAELPIFGNEGRVLVEKPIFRSLAVKTERKCRSETANLWKSSRDEMRKRNFTSLEVLAEQVRKAELQIFASKGRAEAQEHSGNAEAEHQGFGSQGRAEVWKRNFRSLAIKTERKCSQAL